MNAAELRRVLADLRFEVLGETVDDFANEHLLIEALEKIVLPLLEADSELVERVRWCRKHSCSAVPGYEYCYASPTVFPTAEVESHRCQLVVLAALITTDEGSAE